VTAQTQIRAVARIANRAVRIEPFEGSRWRLRRMRLGYGNSIDSRACNRLMDSELVKRGESRLTTFRQPIMSRVSHA
jgi:hypothetical protein